MAGSQAILSDMITNLPDEVMKTILMKLPTRDVVRTSILSRKWRYRWTEVPQFLFDKTLWDSVAKKHSAIVTFITILYQFMSNHKGPVLKFVLSVFELDNCPEIDNLIMFLSRNNIEELTLEMWTHSSDYLLPSSIFTCQELKHLNLISCCISTHPLVFKGFSKLKSLKLDMCSVSDEALRILLSESPLLELVDLRLYSNLDLLYVDAPNLRTFIFGGFTKLIIIKRAPLLASVSISQFEKVSPAVECNFSKLFQGLLSVESLCLNDHIVQILAVTDHKDPITLVHLKHVSLDPISFNDILALQFTFRLLRSSPNLKSIQIEFHDDKSSHAKATTIYLEGEDYSDIWPNELEDVKLINISGTKPELEFIKLLLAKSPTLRKIHIKPRSFDHVYPILTEVIKFQRISKDAQVFFMDGRGLPSD